MVNEENSPNSFNRSLDLLKKAVNDLFPDPPAKPQNVVSHGGDFTPSSRLKLRRDRRLLRSLSPEEIVAVAKKRNHHLTPAQAVEILREARGSSVDDLDTVLSGMGAS